MTIMVAEFVRKTVLGYKEVPGGQSDAECTHVVLTLDEYDRMVMGRARAESEIIEAKKKAAASIERAKQEAQTKIQKDREEMQKIVDSLNVELEQERRDSDYLAGLMELRNLFLRFGGDPKKLRRLPIFLLFNCRSNSESSFWATPECL